MLRKQYRAHQTWYPMPSVINCSSQVDHGTYQFQLGLQMDLGRSTMKAYNAETAVLGQRNIILQTHFAVSIRLCHTEHCSRHCSSFTIGCLRETPPAIKGMKSYLATTTLKCSCGVWYSNHYYIKLHRCRQV